VAARFLGRVGAIVLVVAAALVPVMTASTPASADTIVDGCTIVSNPTPTHFTSCAGDNFAGADLSGVNLSYANLAGAAFEACERTLSSGITCVVATLTGAPDAGVHRQVRDHPRGDLSGANLSGADLAGASIDSGVDFTAANLSGANLSDTTVSPRYEQDTQAPRRLGPLPHRDENPGLA
jgi:Pentapeptide repeats (8 copies)